MKQMPFSTFRLAFKNTLWQILGRGMMLVCSFLIVFLLTRLLGTARYGDYLFLTTTVLLFFNLADFGTGATAVRMISQEKKRRREIFSAALVLKTGLSLLSFLVLNLAAFFFAPICRFKTGGFNCLAGAFLFKRSNGGGYSFYGRSSF